MQFFYQDFVDVTVKRSWSIGQAKRHYLILEVAIAGSESRLLVIAFSKSHMMESIG